MAAEKKAPRKKMPEGLWSKCPKCEQIVYNKELATNGKICPKCGYCFTLSAAERVAQLIDEGTAKELYADMEPGDPLEFIDGKMYKEKAAGNQKKSGVKEAAWAGTGLLDGVEVALGVMNFNYMGGSMGSVVGEKLARIGEVALDRRLPLIIVSTSGGARMHEGIYSLMQMAKVSAVLCRLKESGVPFISILADPTTGGVTASFAMLGDVIYAEPGALIGFAGPRVIEQTIRQTLPEGFQRPEFLMKHGIIDRIIPRKELKQELRRTLKFLEKNSEKVVFISSALRYINSLGASGMKFDLNRMRLVMKALGHPQDQFPSIHIAGTNGKGSTAAMLANSLKLSRLKVGLYTSPHLMDLRERFQINGKLIPVKKLSRITTQLRSVLRRSPIKNLTQFEFLTVIAFVWFAEQKIDIGVIEVGLGGRLDATNVMRRVLISVITNIDLDHTDWLGNTREKIAFEKAGIIKPEVPVVTGASDGALKVIQRAAKKNLASLTVVSSSGKNIGRLKLIGTFQKKNAALAFQTLKLLSKNNFPLSNKAIIQGLRSAFWPGRFERINRRGQVFILDGAHNPAAVKVLAQTLKEQKIKKVRLLFGVLRDKRFDEMIRTLAPFVQQGVVVPVSSTRSADPQKISEHSTWKSRVRSAASLEAGLKMLTEQKNATPILITGSLYLVGEARKRIINL